LNSKSFLLCNISLWFLYIFYQFFYEGIKKRVKNLQPIYTKLYIILLRMVKNKRALTIKPLTTDLENVQVINKCDTCKSNIYTNKCNFFDNKILCHDCSLSIIFYRCPLCMIVHIKSETVKFDLQNIKSPKLNKVKPLTNLSPKFIKSNIREEIMICKKCNNNTNTGCCWFF
jgi:hypothetical protein